MGEATAPEGARIAGFWRRLVAAVADAIVLAAPAYVIGNMFYDDIAALGQDGRFIGLAVSLAYFGILNSSIGGGQTLGKRLLGIKVVGASGEPIGLPRALLRSFVLALPFYLNGFDLSPFASGDAHATMLLGVAASFIVFGWSGALAYLYVFNRRTRQSLHDLLVESFVVRVEPQAAVAVRVWPVHFGIAIAVMAISLAGPMYLQRIATEAATTDQFASMRDLQKDIAARDNIGSVDVRTEWMTFWSSKGGQSTTNFLIVTVHLRKRVESFDPIVDDVARAVLRRDPKILGQDKLRIIVVTGFDLGIVRVRNSWSDVGTPDEWRRRLEGKGELSQAGASDGDPVTTVVRGILDLLGEIQPRH